MKLGYICDNCNKTQTIRSWVFNCIQCGKEICENCMFGWATCKECAQGKSKEEIQKRWDDL